MSGLMQFIMMILALVVGWGAYSLRSVNVIDYFRTKTGLGILKGIVLAIFFALLLGLSPKLWALDLSGSVFNSAGVFIGLDYANRSSPFCVTGGIDDRTTSNVGVRGNVYESSDSKFRLNGKYTHHSCAFNVDDRGYDALGVELEYRLF